MNSEIQLRIPGYAIQEQIAEGGFGVVWRAADQRTGATVAIKVLHAELIGSHDIILRFKREADTIAQLRHPNVVELYRYGRLIDGRPYLVMEYLSGDNLAQHVERYGPMAPEQVLEVLQPLCDALGQAHEMGIVHRDLKASNVVLSQEDGGLRVVLLDFGIAKLLEQTGEPITAVRQTIGSPPCISPEQIRGDYVDGRADVYGLGCLAFHMLTGSPPFVGAWMTVMDQHLFADRPRPSDRLDITTAFDEVVVRAMSLEPGDRYAGPRQFLMAWEASLRDPTEGISQPEADGATRQVIGCYLDVHADVAVLGEPEDWLIDDMASVLPTATNLLEGNGFVLAYESGDSALFVMPYDPDPRSAVQARVAVVNLTALLIQSLRARPEAHPSVYVNLFLHTADAYMIDGEVAGGTILDSTAWVVAHDGYGVFGTGEVCADIDFGKTTPEIAANVFQIY